jgi:type 1 glutamine amidotransferase
LKDADLLLVSIRRQALPERDLAAVRKHVEAGRAVIGIRTASHAFDARKEGAAGTAQWPEFDAEVLGGHYTGHHGKGATPTVTVAEGAREHPILERVSTPFASQGTLYKTSPLARSATPLLIGTAAGAPSEPVVWTNERGKARVFYTSLGHEEDFKNASFVRMLANAVEWGLGN